MKPNVLKILFTTNNKKLKERQKRRQTKINVEKDKVKMERKLWELAEEYEGME